jgi:hypothetical protein
MRNMIFASAVIIFLTAALMAEPVAATSVSAVSGQEDPAAPASAKKKIFMQVGAVEKVEGDKYVMRKTETRFEFFLDENVKIFLRAESSFEGVNEKNYIVIKGPKNKKVVLANSVYVYNSREEYEDSADKKEESTDSVKKVFSTVLEGTVTQKSPLIIRLADGTDYTVSYDEDTYWIITAKTDKNELKAGERIKLYFDKLYSIRYKNYPVKIIVDRVKAGF